MPQQSRERLHRPLHSPPRDQNLALNGTQFLLLTINAPTAAPVMNPMLPKMGLPEHLYVAGVFEAGIPKA
jgi:hypothetical protein